MIEENHEKIPVRLVGTGIWTRDLPNVSLVRYHGATSLRRMTFVSVEKLKIKKILHKISTYEILCNA